MKKALLPLMLALALTGCAIPPGSPMMALTTSDTRQAVAVLAQRTPDDIAATDKLIARIEPGKAGWCRLVSGKPFVAIRNSSRPDMVNIWITDQSDQLSNIAARTEYRGGHVYLHNPTLTPWRSWEEVKARALYDQLASRLAAQADTAPSFGPWPPAQISNPAQAGK